MIQQSYWICRDINVKNCYIPGGGINYFSVHIRFVWALDRIEISPTREDFIDLLTQSTSGEGTKSSKKSLWC